MITNAVISTRQMKGKYGVFSNVRYVLKCLKEWDKVLFCFVFTAFLLGLTASMLANILPAQLVALLGKRSSPAVIVCSTTAVALLMFACNAAVESIYSDFEIKSQAFCGFFASKYLKKMMRADFFALDMKEFKNLSESAWKISRHGSGVEVVMNRLPCFVTFLACTVVYGAALSAKSVFLTLIIVCSVVVDMRLLIMARRRHQMLLPEISKDSHKAEYITANVNTAQAGKDIRIYHMLDWILKKYDELLEDMDKSYRSIHNWYFLRNVTAAVFNIAKNGIAYFLLLRMLVEGSMTAAEFVFYIGAIGSFATSLEMLIRSVEVFVNQSPPISNFRELMEVEENFYFTAELSEERTADILKGPVAFEFRHVSFSYSEEGGQILSDVSFTIHKGEKLALLGLNGAGKTTMVKLLCGFYQPDEGEILANGVPIYRFDREQYLKCISVLFQDAIILPLSVDQNLTGIMEEHDMDRDKLHKALSLSGFLEKYKSLPHQGKTMLVKELNAESVDFSGGEKQKMMFARALYKDASVMILDEPTAALDPIAENELYMHYGEAMQGKTGIFISHRLSSTRFCDRIFLLENGHIIEEGTHENLLAKGGRYAELYELQSQYYKEQEAR